MSDNIEESTESTESTESIEPISMFELAGMTPVQDESEESVMEEEEVLETKETNEEAETEQVEKKVEKKETKPDDSEIIDLGDGLKESKKQIREILKADKSIRGRFGEVGRKEEEVRKLQKKVQEDLSIISEHLKNAEADPANGFLNILEAFGLDGRQTIKQLEKAIEAKVVERMNLSDYQKEALEAKEDLEYTKKKLTAKQEQEKAAKEQQELGNKILQAASQQGLSQEEYAQAYKEIITLYNNGKLPELDNADVYKAANYVIEHGKTVKMINKIDSVLDSIDTSLKNDDDLMRELIQVYKSGVNISDEDIADIAKAIVGETKQKDVKPAVSAKSDGVEVLEENEASSDEQLGYLDLINA